jgi:hypothetical protein
MRLLQNAAIVTIMILCGQPVHAGVVMSETEARSGLGDSSTVNKTVYIEGNKQKIKTQHDEQIIDLDKGVLYEIDPTRKSYVRKAFALQTKQGAEADGKLSALAFKKTGRTRSIDGYSCEEYRGIAQLDVVDITIDQCKSSVAPGARELVNFQKKVAARLEGRGPADSADSSKGGMPLEESVSIKPRIPATSSRDVATSAAITTTTVIKNIQVKSLPSATFEPPADFRMEAPRQETAITTQPNALSAWIHRLLTLSFHLS